MSPYHSPALPAALDKLSLTLRKLPLLFQEIIWDFPSSWLSFPVSRSCQGLLSCQRDSWRQVRALLCPPLPPFSFFLKLLLMKPKAEQHALCARQGLLSGCCYFSANNAAGSQPCCADGSKNEDCMEPSRGGCSCS